MSIALNHLDTGGEGTPLVVIHGLLGSADNWRSHVRKWQAERRVIAVDLRNHGRSPHVAGMGYAQMADDVLALLDRLDVPRAHLLGHSMGGKVAISLARLAPERVASLIVADIAPRAYGHGHDAIFAALRRVEAGTPANRGEADALLAEHVAERPIRLFLATNLERDAAGYLGLRIGLDEIEGDYDAIMAAPAGEGAFPGPTLVIRGSRSDYVTDAMLPALHDVLPGARVETLEAGHWLHAEQPEAFQEVVNAFLAEQRD
ncbi:alpha/beta fold hydrolase [Halomonas nitroreducens]|uniref:Alpha/beta fold hydrolase n=1 Tax=Halomonas nitroreducens TaxID=447425 RepID=A0A431V503_9GAMM|nr:alpha/beta fold hydrolase [Halomonas nitroreducens]RTR04989.1 alpha/beta fold hydrolase [Halomonas nitroreducens]